MIGNPFVDDHRKTVEEKVRVSFIDDENPIAERPDLGELPSFLDQNSVDHLKTTQVGLSLRTGIGYRRHRSSSRIERLAKPLARFAKPSNRLSAVFRETDHQIPRSVKGPYVAKGRNQVVRPPPRTKTTTTGVSRAALKYEASDHIKRLAKHRPMPKADDQNKYFSVKPLSLVYKPSLRIQQLSKPRIREEKM
ncbi:PREDICTED: uncharacterized protein LOC107164110 [Diuraphis noxia]|uniref:uncharacterized protein LOC107164110 n=1 Tax=Diuraphis noxia TaxID=143948 RepID=UPI0007635A79|nr:PREDICTED: uncharacterized protein LOC107164110 [Diuraphis noxia]